MNFLYRIPTRGPIPRLGSNHLVPNRGDNSLVVHSFDPETGKMAFVQRITDGINTPRNYAIDPSGKWLVCANLHANTATIYGVDTQTGRLTLTGTVQVPEALCVRFVPVGGS